MLEQFQTPEQNVSVVLVFFEYVKDVPLRRVTCEAACTMKQPSVDSTDS